MGGKPQDSCVAREEEPEELIAELERIVDVAEMRSFGGFDEFHATDVPLLRRLIEVLTEQETALEADELEFLSNGVMRLGAENIIEYANPAAAPMLGYDNSGEIVQEPVRA